jgi:hypothetical protein
MRRSRVRLSVWAPRNTWSFQRFSAMRNRIVRKRQPGSLQDFVARLASSPASEVSPPTASGTREAAEACPADSADCSPCKTSGSRSIPFGQHRVPLTRSTLLDEPRRLFVEGHHERSSHYRFGPALRALRKWHENAEGYDLRSTCTRRFRRTRSAGAHNHNTTFASSRRRVVQTVLPSDTA